MSDFRIDKITNRDGSAGTQICGVSTFSGTSGMQLPVGPTEYRGGRGRAVRCGGRIAPANRSEMDYVEIATTCNAVTFGDLSAAAGSGGVMSSSTRGVVALAWSPNVPSYSAVMDYITYSSSGGVSRFGDLVTARGSLNTSVASNNTRGLVGGGRISSGAGSTNAIEFITIASTGNSNSFGQLNTARTSSTGLGNQTRAVFAGGYTQPTWTDQHKSIEYVTIATKGNGQEFGELFTGTYRFATCSSPTRGLFLGGRYLSSAPDTISGLNTINYITIATFGNVTDFGDLNDDPGGPGGASSSTRGLCLGGFAPSNIDTIDYVTISTTGNATDFGNLTQTIGDTCAGSDSHGGLG